MPAPIQRVGVRLELHRPRGIGEFHGVEVAVQSHDVAVPHPEDVFIGNELNQWMPSRKFGARTLAGEGLNLASFLARLHDRVTESEKHSALRRILDNAVVSDGVTDIFALRHAAWRENGGR